MGCFSTKAPAPPNYGQITRDTLQAQVDLAPQQYAVESQYQPLYADLALANMSRLLYGTPGGPETYSTTRTADQAGWYDADGNFLGSDRNQYRRQDGTPPGTVPLGADGRIDFDALRNPDGSINNQLVSGLFTRPTGRNGGGPWTETIPEGVRWLGKGAQWTETGTRETAAQTGLLELLRQQQSAQRAGDIADVMELGPRAREALLAANPESAALLAKLNAQANTGLDAGTNLTPEEQRAMQQAARAAWAARGFGASNGAAADELLAQFNLGQQLQRQRQTFAQSVLGNNQAILGDPFMQILGRGSNALGQAQSLGQQAGPSLFNPEAGLGLAASNYATQVNFAAANNPLANISGLLGGVGRAAGGLSSLF